MNGKFFQTAVLVCVLAGAVGCGSLQPYDGVKREAKNSIEVYEGGRTPSRPYKVIMTFSSEAGIGEEAKWQRDFTSKAKKLGADAIIFKSPQQGAWGVGPFGGGSKTAYSAVAVVYN